MAGVLDDNLHPCEGLITGPFDGEILTALVRILGGVLSRQNVA